MLAEDTKFLSQRQRTLLLTAKVVYSELHVPLSWFFMPQKSHRTDTKGLWWMPGHEVSCNRGNTEFRGFIVCIVSESQPALFPRGETLPSPRLLAINTTCRNGPCKEWLRLCIHGIPSKNTQGHSGPKADCLSQQSTPQPTITHSWPNLNFYMSMPLHQPLWLGWPQRLGVNSFNLSHSAFNQSFYRQDSKQQDEATLQSSPQSYPSLPGVQTQPTMNKSHRVSVSLISDSQAEVQGKAITHYDPHKGV